MRSVQRLNALGLFLLCLLVAPAGAAESRPNILFMLADDVNYDALSCYGGQNVQTPTIDRLAKEGLQFNRAYCAIAMCAPFRASLYTGLYPYRSGVIRNHAPAKEGTRSVIQYLEAAGYRVGIIGKKHTAPKSVFPWTEVAKEEMAAFMAAEGPWCLFYCSYNAHAPWTEGDASRFDAEDIQLLPTQHDNPATREVMTRYYAEVEALDGEVRDCLAALADSGKEQDTLVMFSSEQGWPLGFSKWTAWNTGVRTGLIARWPGRIAPGRQTDALVQICDVLPTLLEAVGEDPVPEAMDGRSFLEVLTGGRETHRDYVYGMHNNLPEGEPYAIRYIRGKEYHYIWNIDFEKPYHEKHIMQDTSRLIWWPALKKAALGGDVQAMAQLIKFSLRPKEELYRADEDIYQIHNLADDPALREVKASLRAELRRWMKQQGDPGKDVLQPHPPSAP